MERIARSHVFVLPSIGEVFPMTVLEAMAAGTPVVITRDCGIADMLESHDAALVCDSDVASLTESVETLLAEPTRAAQIAVHARKLLQDMLSIGSVVSRLDAIYADNQ
jgi:glycosyltransferase involved in cell wall biosynthesis